MQIVEDPNLKRQAIDLLRTEYGIGSGSRPGLHQSELSYCLTKAYWDRVDPEKPTDKEALLWSIGFGLERVLLFSGEVQPEPIVVDGISLSLDSVTRFDRPMDLKSTRMWAKGRKDNGGFQLPEGWKRQFMAYRYGLNKNQCQCGHSKSAHLKITQEMGRCHGADWGTQSYGIHCHTNCPRFELGDPEYTFGVVVLHLTEPEVTAWTLTFTPEELQANWMYLLQRKMTLESMLTTQSSQPFMHNAEWECQNCRYLTRCQLTKSIEQGEFGI